MLGFPDPVRVEQVLLTRGTKDRGGVVQTGAELAGDGTSMELDGI
jgi:hypothetical protein